MAENYAPLTDDALTEIAGEQFRALDWEEFIRNHPPSLEVIAQCDEIAKQLEANEPMDIEAWAKKLADDLSKFED